jgi:hypothetical protein
METIERDIEDNEGIYPFNNGRLSLAEVCRRASVHKVTLQGSTHRTTTKVVIKNWLDSLGQLSVKGAKTVRKRVTASIDEWRDRYFTIAQKYNEMYAIHMVSLQTKLEASQARISELESENMDLRIKLSGGSVAPILRGLKKEDD